jgi:hypothetical protein
MALLQEQHEQVEDLGLVGQGATAVVQLPGLFRNLELSEPVIHGTSFCGVDRRRGRIRITKAQENR